MLGDGEGYEGPVKGSTCPGDEELLGGEEGEVVGPDAGHFVHGDEGSFKGVVEGVDEGVGGGEVFGCCFAFCEVGVP